MAHSTEELDEFVAALMHRRSDAPLVLDHRARQRLAEVVDDPEGHGWMESAGLMATDSCGYPVEGGFYDRRDQLGSLPEAAADPGFVDAVMARIIRDWADDYVLTGQARLDRPWHDYLEAEA